MKRKRKPDLRRILLVMGMAAVCGLAIWALYRLFFPIMLKSPQVQVEYKAKYSPLENVKGVFLGDADQVQVIGDVDTNTEGEYPITYQYGNHTQKAVIHVQDTQGPEMEVKNLVTDMEAQLTPEDFIVSISDASPYTVTFEDESVLNKSGRQRVTLVATDDAGNVTKKTVSLRRRTDRTAPTVTGTREAVTIKQGKEFTMEDLTVTDNLDPEPVLTFDETTLDMTTPGTYNVAIKASDRTGNFREYVQTVNVVEDPEYGGQVVYLTFDDGPSPITAEILDVLKENNVKATFFVTGNGQPYNDLIKRAYDEGHTIALHTYSHDYATVYASEENYFKDLQQISDMVEDLTGEQSKVIRFPGGSSNTISANYSKDLMKTLVKEVQDKGYQYFDWNVDSTDASGNNIPVSQIVSNATACSEDYCNVLFHDSAQKGTTVKALPEIIKEYKKKGYKFLPLHVDSPAAQQLKAE